MIERVKNPMDKGVMILIFFEILVLLYNFGNKYNETFAKKSYEIKTKIINKLKLNINVKNQEFTNKRKFFLIFLLFLNLFLTTKIIIRILIFFIAFFILKLNMSYEKYEKVFKLRNPNKKKYNFYLLGIIIAEVLVLVITFVLFK